MKLGHTHSCYINTTLCKAMSLPIQLLSPHFPKVRYIKRLVYKMSSIYRKMLQLETSLTSADLDTLNEIITAAQENTSMYKHHQAYIILSDEDIISKYSNSFKALTKCSMDTPHACISCERLCYKRNISKINKFKVDMAKSPF